MTPHESTQRLAQRLEDILNTPGQELASLAVVAFANNCLQYEGYFGNRFIDPADSANNLPVTRQTTYRVASISKLVTTLGAMRLVEQGKLDLDQDISAYFQFPIRNPQYPDIPITTRMLLSHTSSIRDGDEAYSLPLPYTIKDFFEPTGAFYHDGLHWGQPGESPGVYFHYANLNFGLIGTLIEILSGQRFDRYMQQHVLSPLGIEAGYNVRDFSDEALRHIAVLYRKQTADGVWHPDGDWIPQTDDYRGVRPDSVIRVENPDVSANIGAARHATLDDYEIGANGTLFSPQGGLRIAPRDLVKIALLLCHGGAYDGVRLVQPETVQQMLRPVWRYDPRQANGCLDRSLMRCWGLGMQRITDYSAPHEGDRLVNDVSLRYVGHHGEAYGLLSGLWFDPATQMGWCYCIGGVSVDPYDYPGEYSGFFLWEEQIMTALYEEVLQALQRS